MYYYVQWQDNGNALQRDLQSVMMRMKKMKRMRKGQEMVFWKLNGGIFGLLSLKILSYNHLRYPYECLSLFPTVLFAKFGEFETAVTFEKIGVAVVAAGGGCEGDYDYDDYCYGDEEEYGFFGFEEKMRVRVWVEEKCVVYALKEKMMKKELNLDMEKQSELIDNESLSDDEEKGLEKIRWRMVSVIPLLNKSNYEEKVWSCILSKVDNI